MPADWCICGTCLNALLSQYKLIYWPKKHWIFPVLSDQCWNPFLKKSRNSRTHFPFFKDSIQCKKEPWVHAFFSSSTTRAILSSEGLSVSAHIENVGWINLAQKLKDFPAATAIFKDSQGVSKPCISAFTAINYNNTVKPMTHCWDATYFLLLLTSLSWSVLIWASFLLISSRAVRYKLEMFFFSIRFSSLNFWLWKI